MTTRRTHGTQSASTIRPIYYELAERRENLDGPTRALVDLIWRNLPRAKVSELISLMHDEVLLRLALETIPHPSDSKQVPARTRKRRKRKRGAPTPKDVLAEASYHDLVEALTHIKYARHYH